MKINHVKPSGQNITITCLQNYVHPYTKTSFQQLVILLQHSFNRKQIPACSLLFVAFHASSLQPDVAEEKQP